MVVHDDGSGRPPALIVGGRISGFGDQVVNNIAKWDGTRWTALGEGFPSTDLLYTQPHALASFSGTSGAPPALYAGGRFAITPTGDKYIAKWQECPPCLLADINCDSIVNVVDLLAVINSWGQCAAPGNCPADVAPPPDGDSAVNVADLLLIINNWG